MTLPSNSQQDKLLLLNSRGGLEISTLACSSFLLSTVTARILYIFGVKCVLWFLGFIGKQFNSLIHDFL